MVPAKAIDIQTRVADLSINFTFWLTLLAIGAAMYRHVQNRRHPIDQADTSTAVPERAPWARSTRIRISGNWDHRRSFSWRLFATAPNPGLLTSSRGNGMPSGDILSSAKGAEGQRTMATYVVEQPVDPSLRMTVGGLVR